MSRSRRKSKHFPTANCMGMKWFKRYLHSKERMKLREKIRMNEDCDFQLVPWDEWASPRDGIHYWADATKKDMRK